MVQNWDRDLDFTYYATHKSNAVITEIRPNSGSGGIGNIERQMQICLSLRRKNNTLVINFSKLFTTGKNRATSPHQLIVTKHNCKFHHTFQSLSCHCHWISPRSHCGLWPRVIQRKLITPECPTLSNLGISKSTNITDIGSCSITGGEFASNKYSPQVFFKQQKSNVPKCLFTLL